MGLTSGSEEKPRPDRERSYSSATESDDFSLWSDTGDIAEQLADEEDPLRIELDPLNSEGRALNGRAGRGKKVAFKHDDHTDHNAGGVNKEAIVIPNPPPRQISKVEIALAFIMAPGDPQAAKARGLVGKPLLYFTSVFVSLGVFLFGYDQGVMSGIITYEMIPISNGLHANKYAVDHFSKITSINLVVLR